MRPAADTRSGIQPGPWVWLFPLTYLAHLAEEYWGGDGFSGWIDRVAGVELSTGEFLAWNGFALVLMSVGAYLVLTRARMHWLVVVFATVVTTNSLAHLLGSLLTDSYSPGLFTALVLWVPLGAVVFARSWGRVERKTFWRSVLVGTAIHGIVLAVLLGTAYRARR